MFCTLKVVIIYLRFLFLILSSDSTNKTPLPKFGFLACGVYQRFTHLFLDVSFLWHFIRHYHIRRLRLASPSHYMYSLIYWTITNTTIITDCASMDFPNISARLPKATSNIITKNLIMTINNYD